MNPLDYHVWGTMLEKYHKLLKHKTTDEIKVALQTIWEQLPQELIIQGGPKNGTVFLVRLNFIKS